MSKGKVTRNLFKSRILIDLREGKEEKSHGDVWYLKKMRVSPNCILFENSGFLFWKAISVLLSMEWLRETCARKKNYIGIFN